jgi:rare lipoprotein A
MDMRLAVGLLAVALCGCANKKVAGAGGAPAPPRAIAPQPGDTETGIASWYGHPYHGRRAANGQVYDMEELVAAHRTLPFDTLVRVFNLRNDKTVDVRIIDRGPFIDGRIIDLSRAAARAIELIGPGIGPVRLEILRAPDQTGQSAFAVQVGAFRDPANAERMRARMAAAFGSARLLTRPEDPLVRVLVGTEATEDAARALAARIRAESGERTAFILRLDTF